MDAKINEIIEELCLIDPTLKDQRNKLAGIIKSLDAIKPEEETNQFFKEKLYRQLIEKLAAKKTKRGFWKNWNKTSKLIISLSSTAICLVFIMMVFSPFEFKFSILKNAFRFRSRPVTYYRGQSIPYYDPSIYSGGTSPYYDGTIVLRSTHKKSSEKFTGPTYIPCGPGNDKGIPPGLKSKINRFSLYNKMSEKYNTEQYERIFENPFLEAVKTPLSTFSIDVDTASYANVRRFLKNGRLPYKGAVRIEEMINYFSYDYKQPTGKHPFSFTTEISSCPWNKKNKLLMIGIQGKKIPIEKLKPSNLVFLIDVSGSMRSYNKLPLLKKSFRLLINKLRARDRIAIVVYAGAAGLVLPPTSGENKGKILAALDQLSSGGFTAGGAGIKLAYQVAKNNFIQGGNNRIILATDGDFNVGTSSDSALVRMIEKYRNKGVYLTILGFGMGNYKDGKMEILSNKGNGNYAYIDSLFEAKKVLVREMGGTLFAIAKDVKIQIEFNPVKVKSYRLIGYENRILKTRDFADDKKDAGELGSGHTVTALYEIIPSDGKRSAGNLRYQTTRIRDNAAGRGEIMLLKFRYKKPNKSKSILVKKAIQDTNISLSKTSTSFRFAAAVAQWGLLLRDSKYKAGASFNNVLRLAKDAKGADRFGYRAEFIRLVELSKSMKR